MVDTYTLLEMKYFIENKDQHFSKAGWNDDKAIEKVFNDFFDAYFAYLRAVLNSPLIIDKKPLDPFIVGGLASGIAGPVVGVATAVSSAAKKEQWNNTVKDFRKGQNDISYAEKQLISNYSKYKDAVLKNEFVKQEWNKEQSRINAEKIADQEVRKERETKKMQEHHYVALIITAIFVLPMLLAGLSGGGGFAILMAVILGPAMYFFSRLLLDKDNNKKGKL